MKEKENYIVPSIEIIEIVVEQGYATSGVNEGFGMGDGTWI